MQDVDRVNKIHLYQSKIANIGSLNATARRLSITEWSFSERIGHEKSQRHTAAHIEARLRKSSRLEGACVALLPPELLAVIPSLAILLSKSIVYMNLTWSNVSPCICIGPALRFLIVSNVQANEGWKNIRRQVLGSINLLRIAGQMAKEDNEDFLRENELAVDQAISGESGVQLMVESKVGITVPGTTMTSHRFDLTLFHDCRNESRET